MDIPHSVSTLFLVFMCFEITLTRHVTGLKKPVEPINVLRNLLLEDRGQNQCNEGFSYNKLTRKCEEDNDRSNLSERPEKPIDSMDVLRNLILGEKGENQCNEGFSYNKLTGKCEDDNDRSKLSENICKVIGNGQMQCITLTKKNTNSSDESLCSFGNYCQFRNYCQFFLLMRITRVGGLLVPVGITSSVVSASILTRYLL